MAPSSDVSRAVSEADRLHALAASELFGVVGIEALDELVALAARLVGTPVAAVNLIGENRQWTVAGVGLPTGDAARDASLCTFAIAEDDATVIEDLREDARFAGHPRVADGLRFYAGFPLLSREGLAVGAFCVADVRPRVLTDDQLLSLRAVACAAAAQIDARRHVAAARDAGERLQAVIDHAPDAFVSMDSDGRITEWNLEAQRMFGWSREEARGATVSELIIPPELRDAHEHGLARYLSTRQSGMLYRPVEVAAVTKGAHKLKVELTIAATGESTAVCFNAFIRDISERKAAEAVLRASERRLAEAQHIGGVGSFEWDVESNVVSWSDEMCRIAGFAPGEHPTDLAGFIALVHEEDRARVVETIGSTGESAASENDYRLVRPNGDVRWVHGRRRRFITGYGIVRLAGTLQDITEQRAAEYALRDAEERFRRSFDESAIGMALVSLEGHWMKVNDALCKITGYPDEQLVGFSFQDITHPHDVHADAASIRQMVHGDRVSYHTEKRYIHADGQIIWIQLDASLARNAAGEPMYFTSQIQDITERKELQRRLQDAARRDHLTGLLNRRGFEEELERQLAYAARYERGGALLMLDLDNFKSVNDTLGHRAGDELLADMARVMGERLRKTDALGRLGGDEFAVILPEVSVEQARQVVASLIELVGVRAELLLGRRVRIAASIGLVMYDGQTAMHDLLAKADAEMYDAKIGARTTPSV
ncbi:MAG: PAS domain S-box protein [Geodermatophilaceae bacterium]|nr:PAS domain S-box protein [Geodermatophilaceae bacterium]